MIQSSSSVLCCSNRVFLFFSPLFYCFYSHLHNAILFRWFQEITKCYNNVFETAWLAPFVLRMIVNFYGFCIKISRFYWYILLHVSIHESLRQKSKSEAHCLYALRCFSFFAFRLGMQMHIVRLRLESETLLPTHQCWVPCSAAQASLAWRAVSVRHKENC